MNRTALVRHFSFFSKVNIRAVGPYCYSSCSRSSCCSSSYWVTSRNSERDEIGQDCPSSKYASIDRVGFLM